MGSGPLGKPSTAAPAFLLPFFPPGIELLPYSFSSLKWPADPKLSAIQDLFLPPSLKNFCLLPDCPQYISSVQSLSHVQYLLYHGVQHARLPCPSPTSRACSNSCSSSWRCHPTISSSVVPFSSCLQSFPASGSFPMSQFFASCGQSIGVSASDSVQWIFRTDFL